MKAKFNSKNFKEIEMSDSDSGDEAVVDKALVWENDDTIIRAGRTISKLPSKRPVNSVHNMQNNMTSFRDEIPRNFMKQHHLDDNYSQRNMDREHSPISMRSDIQNLNFRGYSQQSIADGTDSMISEAPSNISCAVDIASAIKVGQYNSAEAKMITDAVIQRFGKRSLQRGGIRKNYKRNKQALKKIINAMMKALEEDNSEQSSNCSTSSEEFQTARSEYPHGRQKNTSSAASLQNYLNTHRRQRNISSAASLQNFSNTHRRQRNISSAASLQNYPNTLDLGPARLNTVLSRAVINNGIDKTESLKQDNFKNTSSAGLRSIQQPALNTSGCMMPPPPTNIIPSRLSRAKQSVMNPIIEDNVENDKNEQTITNDLPISNSTLNSHSNETHKEIIGGGQCVEKIISHSKTIGELGKEPEQVKDNQQSTNTNDEDIFTKPGAPARMSNPINDSNQTNLDDNTSDLTKSSFMRRKLFTQTLDITKTKENGDSDEVLSNSPLVNIYKSNKKGQKTSLTRSNNDESSKSDQQQILELMKKIVSPEEMNIITEPTITENNTNNKATNVLNSHNNENFSDTYTDEEDLFHFKTKLNETCIKKSANITENAKKIVMNNIPEIEPKMNTLQSNKNLNSNNRRQFNASLQPALKNINKPLNGSRIVMNKKKTNCNNVTRRAAAFWETDTENEKENTFNDTLEETEVSVPNITTNEPVPVNSFEKTLDSLYNKNPNAYKDHMLKIIKNSNVSPMHMKTLIVNIEKCIIGNKPQTLNNNTPNKDNNKFKDKDTRAKSKAKQVTKNTKKNSPKNNKSFITKSKVTVNKAKAQNKVTKPQKNTTATLNGKTKSGLNVRNNIDVSNNSANRSHFTRSTAKKSILDSSCTPDKLIINSRRTNKRNNIDVSNNSANSSYFTRNAARKSILDTSCTPDKLIRNSRRTNKRNNNNQQNNEKSKDNNKATPLRKANEAMNNSRRCPQRSANPIEHDKKQKGIKENSKPVKRKLSVSPVRTTTKTGRGATEAVHTPNKKLKMELSKRTNKVEATKPDNKVVLGKSNKSSYKFGFDKPYQSVSNSIRLCSTNKIDDGCRSMSSTTSTSISMRKRVLMCVP